MKGKKSKFLSVIMAAAILVSTLLLSGCYGLFNIDVSGVQFNCEEIKLCMGQRIDLSSYVEVLPEKATNKEFNVLSGDESVVKIETYRAGGVVAKVYAYGVGLGETTLTAVTVQNNKTATVPVKVTYAEPNGISISPDTSLTYVENQNTVIMQASAVAEAAFKASLSEQESVDPHEAVVWKYNNIETEQTADQPFSVTPSGLGRTALEVWVADKPEVKDTIYINVCDEIANASIDYNASLLVQEPEDYRSVAFALTYDAPADANPDPIVEWFVNGEEKGNGKAFSFKPENPGAYKIEVKINGKAVEFSAGQTSVTVQARGYLQPQDVTLDYDNCYPKVIVRWSGTPGAKRFAVSITNAAGATISDLTTENVALRDKFTENSFDATEYFTEAFGTVFTSTFTVKVKTLGDDEGILTESAWSTPYTSRKVDAAAKPYLARTFYDGARNYYVQSDEEFFEWLEYAMLWRPSSLKLGVALYLDYTYGTTGDAKYTPAQRVIDNAMDKAPFTGLYNFNASANSVNKKICTFNIEFKTDGEPSKKTTGHDEEQWNAIRPHINYDSTKVRSSSYAFPIDAKTPVTVETSDQLYYTAMLGYKPVPQPDSVAETLYSYARQTLRHIISNDMTDAQKLHAIYDWIMWRVLYDHKVLDVNALEESVKYESYYLESVMTNTNYYGVCDAMSKAYALMANIEGFECVRVIGTAGETGNVGGHAWNKVKLDGEWYIVDCTWGDVQVSIANSSYKEAATHQYLLITDAMVKNDHFEDQNMNYPATATKRYPWYDDKYTFDGKEVDFHIEADLTETRMREEVRTLVNYMVENMQGVSPNYTVGIDPLAKYAQYYGYEIVVDSKWASDFNNIFETPFTKLSPLVSALKEVNLTREKDYYLQSATMGDELHICIFFNPIA